MDIVDKVFEGLSLSDQAEKARKITAHQRKKELRKRNYARVLALGSVAAVVVGLVATGVIVNLPKGTSAESEIEVSFPETQEDTATTEETEADAETETQTEEKNNETNSTPVKTTAKKSQTAKKTAAATTSSETTTTTVVNAIDSNAEKTDHGATGGDGCTEYAKNALYCKDAKAQEQSTTPSSDDQSENSGDDSKGDVKDEDSGDTGGETD